MVNRIEPINFKEAKKRYGKLNEDEYATLWELVQLYDLDMVLEGIKVAKANNRRMDYVEKYCAYMLNENKKVEEWLNE